MDKELLRLAQEEYARQLQDYLTKPIRKPIPSLQELIEKYFKNHNRKTQNE